LIYRVELSPKVIAKVRSLPPDAHDALVAILGAIIEDPYDALLSLPVASDPLDRWATFGHAGMVEFLVFEEIHRVVIRDVTWAG
jgi:hypothetical protein